jgi:hypothetical protein
MLQKNEGRGLSKNDLGLTGVKLGKTNDMLEAHDWCTQNIGKVSDTWYLRAAEGGWLFQFWSEHEALQFKLRWG